MKLIFFIAIAFTIVGCNKENLKRPSEDGSHTASWVANDKAYRAADIEVDGGPALYASISVSMDGPVLNVVARNKVPVIQVIALKVTNYTGPGLYQLNNDKNFGRIQLDGLNYTNLVTRKGYINITRDDKSKQILAGTFEFVASGSATSDVITVTKGRFDVGDWNP